MLYLPIYIDRRRVHICPLQENAAKTTPSYFECIVPSVSGQVLFAIKKGSSLLSEKGTSFDIPFFTHNEEELTQNLGLSFKKEANTLVAEVIHLAEGTEIDTAEQTQVLQDFGLTYTLDEKELVLGNSSDAAREITCELRYKNYAYTFVIQLAPNAQIVNAVFDFGSEASQVASLFHDSYAIAPMSLVHHAHDHFYSEAFPDKDASPKDFYQYEDDQNHKHVLLSYFFIKAQGGILHKTEIPFKNGHQSLLKILTSDTEEEFVTNLNQANSEGHFLIPNLKLADSMSFNGIHYKLKNGKRGNFENDEVKELIFQTILNQFIHLLLKRIDAYYSEKDRTQKIHLRLNLLVPNIYPQKRVSRLLSAFQENIKIIFAQEYPQFQGIELLTNSESDASFDFQEYKASKKSIQDKNDHCLLIDAGKGTTDFSIIRCNLKTKSFLSIYRSGMAGAGNLITYAIMEAIVAIITGGDTTKSKRFIKEKILSGDLSRQLDFYKLLEQIKKNYSDLSPIPPDAIFSLSYNNIRLESFYEDGNSLAQLNVFLEKMLADNLRIADYYGIIHTTLEKYTDKLIADISTSQLEKFHLIRLAGRAFGFQLLTDLLRKKLRKFSSNIAVLENPKGTCLQNSLRTQVNINENSNMVGIPVIPEKGSIFSGKLSQFIQRLDHEINAKKENPSPQEEQGTNSWNFFTHGINYSGEDLEMLKIGGYEYELEHADMKLEDQLNLIFVGDKFLVRSAKASTALKLNPKMAKTDDPDVIKSLFPNLPNHNGVPITAPDTNAAGYEIISKERIINKYMRILGKPN
ncbi:hypothetical protein [Spongiimicrobium salis]|uniref:hypothetical protein n=1 Tax=Spongiimicrobium salis TaxID=1667022 RepID=UPI00374CC9D5